MLLATLLACRPSLPPPRTEIEHREVFAEPLDTTYDVALWLPEEAVPGTPLLVVLDGEVGFIEARMSDFAIVEGRAAPHAIVGIGNSDVRGRDYTPTVPAGDDAERSGGYDAFMDWFDTAFLPAIEDELQIGGAADRRAFHGHSYGGLATLSTLFAHQDRYSGFGASSPSVFWDDGILFARQEAWAATDPPPARVYLSMGEHEVTPMNPLFDEMVERLSAQPGLDVLAEVQGGHDHFSAFDPAYAAQLPHLFPAVP